MNVILLAKAMNKMPSEIDEEPLEWILRLAEYHYHAGKQGVTL